MFHGNLLGQITLKSQVEEVVRVKSSVVSFYKLRTIIRKILLLYIFELGREHLDLQSAN